MKRWIAAGALAAACGAALAAGAWHTVRLADGIAIDVPAGRHYLPTKTQQAHDLLLDFSEAARGAGTLQCFLVRTPYGDTLSRGSVEALFASDKRNAQCAIPEGARHFHVTLSKAMQTGGNPSDFCVASATLADRQGRVVTSLGIAAPDAYFMLNCYVTGPSQIAAAKYWLRRWSYDIDHVEDSLRLPGGN